MEIGQRINLARTRFTDPEMTPAALGKKLRVSGETIRSWERGDTQPRPHRYQKIADLLKVRKDWLVLGIEPMEPGGATTAEAIENQIMSDLDGLPADVRRALLDLARAIRRQISRT